MEPNIYKPSIYKGTGIYKTGAGGGGGGFVDGGELVDNDFIEIINNTISTYENTSRNELNFFVRVVEDSIVNAIVDIDNETNASVNVFVEINGLFTPLTNIGGNTINSGDEYYLKVTGDTYVLELKTSTPVYPTYADFGEIIGILPITKIGTQYWTKINTQFYSYSQILSIDSSLNNGWRVPRVSDVDKLITTIGGTSNGGKLAAVSFGGTDDYGFGATPNGYYNPSLYESDIFFVGMLPATSGGTRMNAMKIGIDLKFGYREIFSIGYPPNINNLKTQLRFVKNI